MSFRIIAYDPFSVIQAINELSKLSEYAQCTGKYSDPDMPISTGSSLPQCLCILWHKIEPVGSKERKFHSITTNNASSRAVLTSRLLFVTCCKLASVATVRWCLLWKRLRAFTKTYQGLTCKTNISFAVSCTSNNPVGSGFAPGLSNGQDVASRIDIPRPRTIR
jgi:hypothetical protein